MPWLKVRNSQKAPLWNDFDSVPEGLNQELSARLICNFNEAASKAGPGTGFSLSWLRIGA
jgi:hypothetical protein